MGVSKVYHRISNIQYYCINNEIGPRNNIEKAVNDLNKSESFRRVQKRNRLFSSITKDYGGDNFICEKEHGMILTLVNDVQHFREDAHIEIKVRLSFMCVINKPNRNC